MSISKAQQKTIVLLIILLMTTAQMAVNVYLPSMPDMALELHVPDTLIQLTFTLYIMGYGCSGFIYGPLSDHYGRRIILLVGLSIFIAATLLAATAHSIEVLLLARLLQGLGIGCGDIMGRAIMCDVFSKSAFVKAASLISMAAPAVPLAAPVVGGYVQAYLDWRMNFVLMLLYGMACTLIVYLRLPETHKNRHKHQFPQVKKVLKQYWQVLKNRTFIGYFLPGLIAAFGDICYAMSAPFIVQEIHGWSPIAYGWLGVLTATGVLAGGLFSHRLSHRLSTYHMVMVGLLCLLSSGLVMLLTGFLHPSPWSLTMSMMLFTAGASIIFPNTNAGALTPFSEIAGVAGSLQGGLQTAVSGIFGMLVAFMAIRKQAILGTLLMFAAGLGLFIFWLLLKCKDYRGETLEPAVN